MKQDNVRLCGLGREELARTLTAWLTASPQMGVLALLPEAEAGHLPLLQSVCRERRIPLIGGIFPALITAAGLAQSGVWLLRFDTMVPHFLIDQVDSDPAVTAERLAHHTERALSEATPGLGTPTLYLVFDALIQNTGSMLEDLYLRLADRVAYAGVASGSETFEPIPCVFDGEQIVERGILGVLLPGNTTTVLEHGFSAPSKVMTATATAGNCIITIDWRPAFEVYAEIVQRECGVQLTAANFYEHAVRFPFGMLRANSEVIVRIPVAVTDDGGIFCVGEMRENAMVAVLRAPRADDNACVRRLAGRLQQANGSAGEDLLVFYCAGRRVQLGDAALSELAQLGVAAQTPTIVGALSLGEIGSTNDGGYPLLHNATLVSTPWGRA
jgi:hypothetical protein